MQYFMFVEEGYIANLALAAEDHATAAGNITKEQYDEIRRVIEEKPPAADGYDYRLRADTMQWEPVEIPSIPTVYTRTSLEAMTNAELSEILAAFGISASMNKANMVRLILAAQGGDSIG